MFERCAARNTRQGGLCLLPNSCWFLAWVTRQPEDGDNMFLRKTSGSQLVGGEHEKEIHFYVLFCWSFSSELHPIISYLTSQETSHLLCNLNVHYFIRKWSSPICIPRQQINAVHVLTHSFLKFVLILSWQLQRHVPDVPFVCLIYVPCLSLPPLPDLISITRFSSLNLGFSPG
jgi:hypothetical protein